MREVGKGYSVLLIGQVSSVQFSSCFELVNSQLSPQLNSHAKVPSDKFSTKVGVFPFLMSH